MWLHVGLPKAASTYLQSEVFPRLSRHFIRPKSFPKEFGWLWRINVVTDSLSPVARTQLVSRNREMMSRWSPEMSTFCRENSEAIVSSEGLCGVSTNPLLNAGVIAEFLAKWAPSSRILLVVRRQDTWAWSLYRQLVLRELRYRTYVSFEQFTSDHGGIMRLEALRWAELANIFGQNLGRRSVSIVPFELLSKDPIAFLERIRVWAEAEFESKPHVHHVNPTFEKLGWRREFTRMSYRGRASLKRVMAENHLTHPSFVMRPYHSQWAEDAKQLQALTEFDLREFGYY